MEWIETTLGDIGKVVGGATPPTKHEEYYGGKIAWITPKDLSSFKGRYISFGERSITEKGLASCSAQMVPSNTILFTSRAPIGYIAIAKQSLCTNQGFKSIIPYECIDPLFLYYLLKYNKDRIESMGSGTTFKEISGKTMKSIRVYIPRKIEDQKRISAILDRLDGKIECNAEINDNLQQQAQTIYSSMFITNADPLWKIGHLSDLVSIKYGKDHKKLTDGRFPVYGSGGIMRHVERPLYNKESVLIPRKGTLNNVIYVSQPFWSVDTMFYTEMRLPNVAKYVYHFVKSKDLTSMNAGSAVPSMTTAILNAMEVVIPTDSALKAFEEIVSPMYNEIQKNDEQSRTLCSIRDALLPRLMSGEIDISNIQF